MERALIPRTADGLIEPMIFLNEPPKEKLYPHIGVVNGAIVPMVCASDFEGGNPPDYLDYQLGHERPGAPRFDGTNFDSIIYQNPVLNLPRCDQLILHHAKESLAHSASLPSAIKPLPGQDEQVFSTEAELKLRTPRTCISLTNFGLRVTERRHILARNAQPFDEIELVVTCSGRVRKLTISPEQVENALRIIQSKIPECRVTTAIKKAPALISDYVREQLDSCPELTVLKSTGFFNRQDRWFYIHDGVPSPWPDVIFATGKHIPCRRDLAPPAAFKRVLGILDLSKRLELMLPLFLLLHLGPLFELFHEAGHPPRFVVFLAGTTGSLKTSLALALLRIFQEDDSRPEANFMDTEAALEAKLGGAHGRVLLVDDFCPAVTTASGKAKTAKLEMIIRFIGDQISKSRCKPNMRRGVEYEPAGCCLVTGECTAGSRSSLLRCLVLPIDRGDISGELLETYQLDPELLQTHLHQFLLWSGDHGHEIQMYIRAHFSDWRQQFAKVVRELRLADSGAVLMLMAHILFEYGLEIGTFRPQEIEALEKRWKNALETALRTSEDYTREADPLTMYLTALFHLYHTGKLQLASCSATYSPSRHIGFCAGEVWWLRPEDVFRAVVRYWQEIGQIFPLRDRDVRKLLAANGLIEVAVETRDCAKKEMFVRKASVPGRPRMLALRSDSAKIYLENTEG